MKKPLAILSFLGCLFLSFTLSFASDPATLTQFSTIEALMAGAYDGQVTCQELLSHGDLGLGTFDKLDGEMTVLNGKIYQVKTDGQVYTPAPQLTTPFAEIVRFTPEISLAVKPGTDFPGLEKLINEALANPNIFGAVKLTGRFAAVKARSVPAQKKPYPPLLEAAKHQAVFDLKDIAGTMVGFREPDYAKGITVAGFHLHFISADGKSGGHVLSFSVTEATAEIAPINRFLLILPEKDGTFSQLNLGQDRSKDLQQIEK